MLECPSLFFVRKLSEYCPKILRNERQKTPSERSQKMRFYWRLLRWFGVGCEREPNGIQEVARSIRVSSTNKIKGLFDLFTPSPIGPTPTFDPHQLLNRGRCSK
jgi:hypothetical protein